MERQLARQLLEVIRSVQPQISQNGATVTVTQDGNTTNFTIPQPRRIVREQRISFR